VKRRLQSHSWIVSPVIVCLALLSSTTVRAQAGSPWWPSAGTVILAGGRLELQTANTLVDRIIALAGGGGARIVVIPTASDGLPAQLPSSDSEPPRVKDIRQHFASRGARNVVFLHTRDRQVANTDQFTQVLRSAQAVFFPGGAFRVLDETYHDTLVERELKALLARGGVLAGDSAGAITLGCQSLAWNRQSAALAKVADGLCVLPGVVVTPHIQHIDGDEQTRDVASYITSHPRTIGINLSENTMLILRAGQVEAVGTGAMTVFDASRDKNRPYIRLAGGQKRDLTR
jgi:cyanophycinase